MCLVALKIALKIWWLIEWIKNNHNHKITEPHYVKLCLRGICGQQRPVRVAEPVERPPSGRVIKRLISSRVISETL